MPFTRTRMRRDSTITSSTRYQSDAPSLPLVRSGMSLPLLETVGGNAVVAGFRCRGAAVMAAVRTRSPGALSPSRRRPQISLVSVALSSAGLPPVTHASARRSATDRLQLLRVHAGHHGAADSFVEVVLRAGRENHRLGEVPWHPLHGDYCQCLAGGDLCIVGEVLLGQGDRYMRMLRTDIWRGCSCRAIGTLYWP